MSISAKDVIKYFETANADTSELLLQILSKAVAERDAKRAKVAANLAKARAAKAPAVAGAAPVKRVRRTPAQMAEARAAAAAGGTQVQAAVVNEQDAVSVA